MAKPRPEDFPNVRGDAQMLLYFKSLRRVSLKPDMRHSRLPNCPAIYFVYAEPDIIAHVGKTTSLKNRWAGGHSLFRFTLDKTPKTYVVWMQCEPRMLDVLEKSLIKKLRPHGNRNHSSAEADGFYCDINTRRSPTWTIS